MFGFDELLCFGIFGAGAKKNLAVSMAVEKTHVCF
jgi:hypothetical protein